MFPSGAEIQRLGLASPGAVLLHRRDEGLHQRLGILRGEEAGIVHVVRQGGGLEHFPGVSGEADGLQMPVSLAQVVFGVPVHQEGLDALRAFRHDDGVKQDGKIGGQAAVHQQVFPFFRFNGSHVGGNDLGMDSFLVQGVADFFHGFQADAVRHQQGDAHALEVAVGLGVQAQRRVLFQAADRG